MIYAQGGPVKFAESWQRFLPEASVIREVKAPLSGYISAFDGEALGLAVIGLGGGRQVESDVVNPAVGLSDVAELGAKIVAGQPIMRIHAAREDAADQAMQQVLGAITISDTAPERPALIHERIEA